MILFFIYTDIWFKSVEYLSALVNHTDLCKICHFDANLSTTIWNRVNSTSHPHQNSFVTILSHENIVVERWKMKEEEEAKITQLRELNHINSSVYWTHT